MRILAVNSFYPPYHISGYDLGCLDIVEALKARGHEIKVLTSRACLEAGLVENDIYRWLKPNFREKLDWRGTLLKELVNQTAFKRVCRASDPEVVLFFNPTYVSASLCLLAREMAIPSAYYLADFWYLTYEKDPWFRAWPRSPKGGQAVRYFGRRFRLIPHSRPLHFGQAIFANTYLKVLAEQMNLPMDGAAIVPWGIDVDRFSPRDTPAPKPCRLLYVGQVRPEKGVDTAIRALGILKRDHGRKGLSLTIVGCDPWDPSPQALYQKSFRALVKGFNIQEEVRFVGWRPRDLLPSLYREHDIFLFPGADEGITSLALLEAMASGLAVVSTQTPGHTEILADGKNALVFTKGSAEGCARQVLRLLDDSALCKSVRTQARTMVEQGFRLEKTAEALEGILKKAALSVPAVGKPASAQKNIRLEDTDPGRPLCRLIGPAKWRLRLGAVAVTGRTLFRPKFFWQKGKRLITKVASTAMVITFPFFYEAFFRLAGRRSKRSSAAGLSPKNILVIQLADMGDVLLSSAFLRELRRYRPNAWIGLVVQPSMVNLVEKCPYVDEVIPFRWRSFKDWGNAFSGHLRWWLQASWLTAWRLWSRQLDMAISLRWNNDAPQAAALTLMYTSGAPERVGYRDTPHDRVPYRVTDINRLITRGPVRSYLKHEIELQLEILSSLGATPSDTRVEIWTGQADEDFAQDVLSEAGFSEASPLVAIAPGAAWSFRRWPEERFIALGRWLQEHYGANIVLLAARNELALARRIEHGLIKNRTINLGGRTTIMQMAAVLRRCRLFIGNDSGPVHLAAGVGVPVVGFYGPGEYERFRPWGARHEAIRVGLPCSPCSQDCAFNDPRCIRGISLNRAKEVIAKKLDPLGPPLDQK
jgi:ADP-heptose:LPS heptosyltransferase/glycosyltransferase involved in cell wall biosynthesis